ncbi:universal stress protein UspA2 [Methanosarcina barkeri CM1]|uniref:Universal stress protein UspA2 n=1 Tax=Methanosarcina barkeri CM1 TaxID=796385 RepID=A0A0G3C5D8_METBA|nr:universal stress protein UspA2 [Methanosarcina barkeri CM1]
MGDFNLEDKSYDKIMIATDGSKQVEKAIEAAVQLAKITGARLYSVYVIASAGYTPRNFGWEESLREILEAEAKKAVTFVEEAGKVSGVKVEPVILEGHPADRIMKFAEQEDMDLIVMGTLGRTGLNRFLLGSIAENVVRHSKTPVMVVKGEAENEN